jgi:hypothetical protein
MCVCGVGGCASVDEGEGVGVGEMRGSGLVTKKGKMTVGAWPKAEGGTVRRQLKVPIFIQCRGIIEKVHTYIHTIHSTVHSS